MSNDKNYRIALEAAERMAKPIAHGECVQLADYINNLVGYWVDTPDGSKLSWPADIAAAADRPSRHIMRFVNSRTGANS